MILLILFGAATVRAQAIPLQVREAEVTDEGDLQYSLTNVASQPATAWSVTVLVTDPNGMILLHSAIMTDEYRAEALHGTVSDEGLDASLLRPHRPRRFAVPGPFDLRMQVTVTPAAIVLLDGRSIGDPTIIDRIFVRRAAERDATRDILRQLRDVQADYTGLSALREAIARLSRLRNTGPDITHQIADDLRVGLARVQSDGADPAAVLADQIDLVQREYRCAVQHAAARKED